MRYNGIVSNESFDCTYCITHPAETLYLDIHGVLFLAFYSRVLWGDFEGTGLCLRSEIFGATHCSLTKLSVVESWTRGKIRASLISVSNWFVVPSWSTKLIGNSKFWSVHFLWTETYSPALMFTTCLLVCAPDIGAKSTLLNSVPYEDKRTKRSASLP